MGRLLLKFLHQAGKIYIFAEQGKRFTLQSVQGIGDNLQFDLRLGPDNLKSQGLAGGKHCFRSNVLPGAANIEDKPVVAAGLNNYRFYQLSFSWGLPALTTFSALGCR